MKKFLTIGISITLISSGINSLLVTEASRLQYHYYFLEQQKNRETTSEEIPQKEIREFSQRISPFSRSKRTTVIAEQNTQEETTHVSNVPNLRYSQTDTRSTYSKTNVEQLLRARDENALQWKESVKRVTTRYKNTGGDVRMMETYENDHFSIQVPFSWDPIEGVTHFFKSKKVKDFTITVEKITNNCDTISFTTCAISLSKTRNTKEAYLIISKIKRVGRDGYTILNSDKMTATFTESFFITKTGREETFINRFFIEDLDGGVFLVETKTSAQRAFDFIGTSKRVFDSFRFFQS